MSLTFELDVETFLRILDEKVDLPNDVRDAIVDMVGQQASDNILKKIPVDEGVTKSFWYPSSVRTYVDQSWMTVFFDPKRFGDVGNKKKGWNQRTASNTGWGWGWLSNYDPRNDKSFMWLNQAIREEKGTIKKKLKREVESYYGK